MQDYRHDAISGGSATIEYRPRTQRAVIRAAATGATVRVSVYGGAWEALVGIGGRDGHAKARAAVKFAPAELRYVAHELNAGGQVDMRCRAVNSNARSRTLAVMADDDGVRVSIGDRRGNVRAEVRLSERESRMLAAKLVAAAVACERNEALAAAAVASA
jgi:hypothetical protein